MKHVISGSVVLIIGLCKWVCVASIMEMEQLPWSALLFFVFLGVDVNLGLLFSVCLCVCLCLCCGLDAP